MKMKKVLYQPWIKLTAMLLCVCSVLGAIVSGVGFLTMSSSVSIEESVNRDIANQYAVMLMDAYLKNDGEVPQDLMADINMDCAILKTDTSSESELNKELNKDENYLYGTPMSSYDYAFYQCAQSEIAHENAEYAAYYYTDSLLEALSNSAHLVRNEYPSAEIIDFIFSKKENILYAQTDIGYFPIDQFTIMKASSNEKNQELDEDIVEEREEAVYYQIDPVYDSKTSSYKLTDMRCPDVKKLDWKYLEDSVYIYFQDEILYLKDHEQILFQYCDGAQTISQVSDWFGDSVWPVQVVNSLPAKAKIYEPNGFSNYSMENRGYVHYQEKQQNDKYYWVMVKMHDNYAKDDLFAEAYGWVNWINHNGDYFGIWLVLCITAFLFGFVFLMAAAGHYGDDTQVYLTFFDRIPFEIYSSGVVFIAGMCIAGMVALVEEGTWMTTNAWIGANMLLAALGTMVCVFYCQGIAVRIKSRTFWRYTVLYYIIVPVRKLWNKFKSMSSSIFGRGVGNIKYAFQQIRENTSLCRKTFILFGLFLFIKFITMLAFWQMDYYSAGPLAVWFIFWSIVETVVLVGVVLQMQKLKEGSERIAEGNLHTPIDTSRMIWEFKKHGDNINSVGDGINAAVQDRMKSEHFKTELITNVSHDIKTPLTSIINYVDLLKKQQITDPTMLEYVEVLERQSSRLKKLIEDLMEASKASTGNLSVNFEKIDVVVLLSQIVGEFEERMQQKNLELIIEGTDSPCVISADGRHLWRVFDNLMNNICKYAQAGTRVYMDLSQKEQFIEITFKNISEYRLNISSEELMERFVRGDSSRNTEGSGLGLSIAESLTQLMQGTLELCVDGDLFKVILKFPRK